MVALGGTALCLTSVCTGRGNRVEEARPGGFTPGSSPRAEPPDGSRACLAKDGGKAPGLASPTRLPCDQLRGVVTCVTEYIYRVQHAGAPQQTGGQALAQPQRDVKRTALRTSPLFQAMQPEELDTILGFATERRVRRGQMIVQKGDEGSSMMAVLSGRVRISAVNAEGKEITLNVISPGEVFGEIALLDGQPRSADAPRDRGHRHCWWWSGATSCRSWRAIRRWRRACWPCCARSCAAPAWRWNRSRCSTWRRGWRG